MALVLNEDGKIVSKKLPTGRLRPVAKMNMLLVKFDSPRHQRAKAKARRMRFKERFA